MAINKGRLVISPDGILIKSTLNFFKIFKEETEKTEDKNLIFFFYSMYK